MHASPHCPEGAHDLAARIAALNEAVMDGRFDSARLCLALIRKRLPGTGVESLEKTALALADVLGPADSVPRAGLGRALVDLAEALAALSKPMAS